MYHIQNTQDKRYSTKTFQSMYSYVGRDAICAYICAQVLTRGIKFSANTNYKQELACKRYRKRQGWKHKMIILVQKNCGKERLEDYSTSVAKSCNKSRVVFQSFYTTIFLQQESLLVFSSLPFSVHFTGLSLLVVKFCRKLFTRSFCSFCLLFGSKLVKLYVR